jgi:hypothetical protein
MCICEGGMGTYISGSLLMSAIAAIGIPKLLAGPQKSAPQVSAIEHVHCLLLIPKAHRNSSPHVPALRRPCANIYPGSAIAKYEWNVRVEQK